ncbi:MAG: hypothetical protein NTU88_16190, partial [Armatimonadetes bacterium]|nr:hypothetical protein [Armatimonadota bacterium]
PLKLVGNGINAEFDSKTGRLLEFRSGTVAIPISGVGGRFSAYDFKAKREIPLTAKGITPTKQGVSAKYAGAGLSLDVGYSIKGGIVRVDGTLTNLTDGERAVALTYTIPLADKGLRFSPSLNESVKIGKDVSGSGTVFPIAAMTGPKSGVAMAIPPGAPCMFRMLGSADGLSVRFYLGMSPLTKEFPNSAHFSFIIYPCDPKWGFRDALRRYYAAFPEYYTHHRKGDGLWLFQSTDPPNLGDFLYNETWPCPRFVDTLARDDQAGILSFPYIIVGQREIKHLKSLPASYEQAMAEYEQWSPAGAPGTKESIAAGGDEFLKNEVESSAIKDKAGNYQVNIRNTDWGANSVTFIMNPNPDLFAGEGKHTTGGDAVALVHEWLAEYPNADGIYVDSLGSAWCGKINFRRDHFPYARYPLTFDGEGNVALHNALSHYEFLAPLRDELHGKGKLLMANGLYCYSAKTPEYADVKDTGRFFLAALCDVAGAESSTPSRERWEFYKTAMGRKPYLILKYHWEKPDNVQEVFNQALCYGVFVTNSNGLGKVYWTDPNGYPRDKALYAWYVPLVRKLSKAGWQPVTYASSPTEGVRFERYGDKGNIYFTVYNHADEARECTLKIETKPLGLTKDAKVGQISGPGLMGVDRSSSAITVRTKLAAHRT